MFRSTIGPRSEREQREDQEFIQALRKIPTLQVRDGCMSMDASDLQEEIKALHEVGRRLVDGQNRP
ncbi:hypothetical protein [Pseudomonas amygdali]|uniref:Uncharacterized protein n=2 Tax=Pseudomonas amygdali pv. lachrymans TaxID=53707 RepID=A0ABR5KR00_PSEAV|nr:hypothetical protein [Pseudomonas amygdali]AXH59651.1 hypothetical protein PLA107_030980 [Pseudomonas amygdali pv. lachrymans str. M301315]KPC17079.1 Uncharacterized protein AC499_0281 [Pseudomonas amygdali pv. lachrymans]KPC18038.1 Uncharacterized protein AC499_1240 [Pseudomonas amygdali pv. lachrymans]